MTVAFLFPGQGARNLLAGLKLARAWPEGTTLVDEAAAAANLTVAEVESRGGQALERTEVLQPVLAAICLSIHRALGRAGVHPSLVLGHSLGELPAFAAAGVISDSDAVKVAALRGRLMAREAAKHPGGLLALPSLDAANQALSFAPGLQLAAVNAPDEVLVCGSDEALRAVAARFPSRRVPVSGAWHGDAMAGAVDELRAALAALEFRTAATPLVRNLDGAPGHALGALADQLTRPVQFIAALATARAQGVDTFVTVGPGVVMRGLVRKNLGADVRVLTTEDAHDFERTLTALGRTT